VIFCLVERGEAKGRGRNGGWKGLENGDHKNRQSIPVALNHLCWSPDCYQSLGEFSGLLTQFARDNRSLIVTASGEFGHHESKFGHLHSTQGYRFT